MAAAQDMKKVDAAVRSLCMGYPGVVEDAPWGHAAFKINKKVFVFSGLDGGGFSLSCKLPVSQHGALMLPFASPTHYGMGRYGWVTAAFNPGDVVPMDILRDWIDESFRAIAPKKVVAALGD